jgi:4-amino-4-deoxy-L-arabinose transferase-like glycosyltransferase
MSYSWQTSSAAPTSPSAVPGARSRGAGPRARGSTRALAMRLPRPELAALLLLVGVLNLWALSRNGLANDYYAAAVRSMSTSWHDFLFASLDHSGVMTVDKPPLALWIQALSVRVFGFHSLSILVPQALMGVAGVALLYDLVRTRFGRLGGAVGGFALAVTPITVAISRHNNPDALLVLCSVAALWCAVRAFEHGSTRWLVLAGVAVGLGFETKMGVAFAVVPGIVAAWLWLAPATRGRLHALRQLLAGGGAMVLIGGAWPALVELTPAADRPWISGTSDNRVLSLIFEYNGLGRVDGQAGGPAGIGGGGAGSVFGGSTGPLRLLNSALGGQAGWLLGFALASVLAIAVSSRLRRADRRSGWLIAVGGAFLVTAVLFSFAGGIFHPYYVSLLAPFAAALVGAGAAELVGGRIDTRIFGPLAVAGGVASELVVLGDYQGQLTWLAPLLIVVGLLASLSLIAFRERVARVVAVGAVLGVLLIAPTAWAFDTLGHATSGTFPEGGPSGALASAGMGGFGGGPGARGGFSRGGPPGAAGGVALGAGAQTPQLFGPGGASGSAGALPPGSVGALSGSGPVGPTGAGSFAGRGGSAAGPGGFGGALSTQILAYVKSHGGGTIAVSSQSGAAASILSSGANVAGIGGFSGRESVVSVSWLAQEVSAGKIRWVLDEGSSGGFGGGPASDSRAGSKAAIAAAGKACVAVSVSNASSTSGESSSGSSSSGTLYDCRGRAVQLSQLDTQESNS